MYLDNLTRPGITGNINPRKQTWFCLKTCKTQTLIPSYINEFTVVFTWFRCSRVIFMWSTSSDLLASGITACTGNQLVTHFNLGSPLLLFWWTTKFVHVVVWLTLLCNQWVFRARHRYLIRYWIVMCVSVDIKLYTSICWRECTCLQKLLIIY